jgi:hypothetical protein
MSTESLLQEYLEGNLNLDLNKLDTFDKVKYVKTMDLLDAILKSMNTFLFEFHKLEMIRKQFKETTLK